MKIRFSTVAGIMKVPPAILKEVRKIIMYQLVWYAQDRIKGLNYQYMKHAADYRDLKEELRALGLTPPRKQFKTDESYKYKIKLDLRGMPSSYKRGPKTPVDFTLWLVWELDKPRVGGTLDQSAAAWNPANNTLYIVVRANKDLINWPHHTWEKQLSYLVKKLVNDAEHELLHAVQTWMLPAKESKLRKGYKEFGDDYYASPVEYEPMLKSALHDWASFLITQDEPGFKQKDPKKALTEFVALEEVTPLRGYTNPFFKALKHKSPKRWRKAIKKFMVEINQRGFKKRYGMEIKPKAPLQ